MNGNLGRRTLGSEDGGVFGLGREEKKTDGTERSRSIYAGGRCVGYDVFALEQRVQGDMSHL